MGHPNGTVYADTTTHCAFVIYDNVSQCCQGQVGGVVVFQEQHNATSNITVNNRHKNRSTNRYTIVSGRVPTIILFYVIITITVWQTLYLFRPTGPMCRPVVGLHWDVCLHSCQGKTVLLIIIMGLVSLPDLPFHWRHCHVLSFQTDIGILPSSYRLCGLSMVTRCQLLVAESVGCIVDRIVVILGLSTNSRSLAGSHVCHSVDRCGRIH